MRTSYYTIANVSEGFIKERNSKFYAYAFPVKDAVDARAELDRLKEAYPDANHHCYAWVLGVDRIEERANDDGEPSNSAGKPILRQIQSKGITNTLVVVVRYFGGKKLGVPGLIEAYGEAAKLALESNKVIEKKVTVRFLISCQYGEENHIYRIAKRYQAEIQPRHSMDSFSCILVAELGQKDAIIDSFRDLHKIEIELDDNSLK